MKKTVLTFGLLSGAILAGLGAILVPVCMSAEYDNMEIVGYSAMILAFIVVFFGVRSYRDNVGGGTITFGKALGIGLLMTLIACAMYVAVWEIVYFNFVPDFVDNYSTNVIEKLRRSGATAQKVQERIDEMARFKKLYANPALNVLMTFGEVFPVGLIVALVSAGILRRKPAVA